MKGASSHLVAHEIAAGYEFKWQGGYGALSVSRGHVRRVCEYIKRQKEHHGHGDLWPALEEVPEPGALDEEPAPAGFAHLAPDFNRGAL
jgi:hypothetical protein